MRTHHAYLLTATLLAASALTACAGPSAKGGIMETATQKGGFMGLSTKDAVEATTPAAFKGVNTVVVGGFTVGFVTLKTDSRKAGGGLMGNGFGGKSTAKSSLAGVDKATMQKITDAAYADFVAQLKKAGYTVMDHSEIAGNKDFAGTNSYESPLETSSGIFGANSKTTYMAPTSFGKIRSFMGDVPGYMGGFAFSNPMMGAIKFTEANKGVKVLSVSYTLDFANADGYGGTWTMSSSVDVGHGLTVVPGFSKLTIVGGQMGTFSTANGSLAIGQGITSAKEFADPVDTTTTTDQTLEVAANVIGVLGGVGTNKKRTFDFQTDNTRYTAAATDAVQRANAALVGKAVSLR